MAVSTLDDNEPLRSGHQYSAVAWLYYLTDIYSADYEPMRDIWATGTPGDAAHHTLIDQLGGSKFYQEAVLQFASNAIDLHEFADRQAILGNIDWYSANMESRLHLANHVWHRDSLIIPLWAPEGYGSVNCPTQRRRHCDCRMSGQLTGQSRKRGLSPPCSRGHKVK